MKLLVDIGNSRIKWAWQTDGYLSDHQGVLYEKKDFTNCLRKSWGNFPMPEQLSVANVAGTGVAEQLRQWSAENWNLEPQFARVGHSACGVINAYRDINRLGIDRWLAMIAVWKKYHAAACIVDCGTAVTIDALNGRGEHLGGVIMPGIMMMQQVLYRNTDIPEIVATGEVGGLARTTEQGIASGCTLAVVSLIEHMAKELRESIAGNLCYIITGGGAENIKTMLPEDFLYEPHLVLEGLAESAGENS